MCRTTLSRVFPSAFGVLLAARAAVALPVTVVVTSTADVVTSCSTTGVPAVGTGGCTLRDAITYSNANPPVAPAQNSIPFNLPGSGVQTITLQSDLPSITAATILDGYSQPGASPNTQAVGNDAVLLVQVHCHATAVRCLEVAGGDGSVIEGLVVNHETFAPNATPWSIILSSCCNRVVGNFLGPDPAGNLDPTGSRGGGLWIQVGSNNQIGGPAPADRNVVTTNNDISVAIDVGPDANAIEGNYVGTNATGDAGQSILRSEGIALQGSSNVVRANLISGNPLDGVVVGGHNNVVSGNLIGTDASGVLPLGNGRSGVWVAEGKGNLIGASPSLNPIVGSLFEGNRIAFNGYGGSGGYPGVLVQVSDAVFPLPTDGPILSNSISDNSGLGIDLADIAPCTDEFCDGTPDGVTANDPGDGDDGPNHFQNYPVLASATNLLLQTQVTGTLNSAAHTSYRVQFFSSDACDSSGYGEGETFVDEVFVTTDGSGNASVHHAIFPRVPMDQYVTSTAADTLGNTSELSRCVQVTGTPPPPPPWKILIRFLEEGPIRVPPGVPVELPFGVEARQEAPRAPAGVVTVSDGAGHECEAPLIRSGVGACALTFQSEGTYRVRAHYPANGDFLEGDSDSLTIRVKSGGD